MFNSVFLLGFLTRDFQASCKTNSNDSSKFTYVYMIWQKYLLLFLYFSSKNKGLCVVTRWTQNVTSKNIAWENPVWYVQVSVTEFCFLTLCILVKISDVVIFQLYKFYVKNQWKLFTFFIQCPKNTFVQDGLSCDGGKVMQFFIRFFWDLFLFVCIIIRNQKQKKVNKQLTK